MDLATFRSHYASSGGSVECVLIFFTGNRVTERPQSSRNQLNFFTNARANPQDQIFVFFSDEKSVGVKTMRK
jgi:DNA-directed RNA polymerase I, II, and III subunit RPABC1